MSVALGVSGSLALALVLDRSGSGRGVDRTRETAGRSWKEKGRVESRSGYRLRALDRMFVALS